MCCIDLIKNNIIAVQAESANNKKVVDQSVDKYLDIILDIQKGIREITKSTDELYELIHSCFSSLTTEDYFEIKGIYKTLINNLTLLYTKYRKSDFYSGIKTDLMIFRNSIDDLKEIDNDLETFVVDLPKNEKYINLVSDINALL
ncbi:hypothetical protein [uncultured Bacteroides sp.]|uniref:hypothetical protein n=1 Tax=uncultured Bacteroides sp. TaxID=162156 RepID=UPI002AAC0DEA|nr:hypothetical protein [uncultured Bacteroides sp.]